MNFTRLGRAMQRCAAQRERNASARRARRTLERPPRRNPSAPAQWVPSPPGRRFGTARSEEFLRLLARKRQGILPAKYPLSRCRIRFNTYMGGVNMGAAKVIYKYDLFGMYQTKINVSARNPSKRDHCTMPTLTLPMLVVS